MKRTLMTERQQFAEQNEMSMDFVNWFFDNKKEGCGNAWFIMAAAMWEGWKGGRESIAVELPSYEKYHDQGSAMAAINDCAAAFRSVGLSVEGDEQTNQLPTTEQLHNYFKRLPPDNPTRLAAELAMANREAQPVAISAEQIMEIMLQEWCEWLDDTGHFPDDFVWTGGNGMLFYEPSRWSKLVADRIIANTAPQAPAVPDELLDAMDEVIRISDRDHDAWDRAKAAITACRAAMLVSDVTHGKPVTGNLQETPNGWIACKDRMPEPGEIVIVYAPERDGDRPEIFDFDCICPDGDDPEYWLSHGEHYEHFCCVAGTLEDCTGPSEKAPYTHWMPLPATPEVSSD